MGKEKRKLSTLAFLVCLFVAAFCWFFITFSKDYKTTLDFRIQCVNLPQDKHSVTVSDTILSLTFNQKRLNYFMKPFSQKDRVIYIPIDDLIKTKSRVSVYTFTNREMRDFLVQHGFGPELISVESPEVITFYLHNNPCIR